ncbi:excinuclease ABC subunit UvrC [Desulfitibacter alkalitolerans]|uniref:excinuclease ABC subunit UvrC n=1 Tax=Desulfitibacter alkalitolerans TaxID=264641 RepID=UPI000488112F|nr:excinuclease ABC subunit UvrC [Desulfitibacter alkalitolerans]
MTDIEDKLKRLPDKPGVYLMLSEEEKIIYVGKASSLRSRVRSYFRDGNASVKVSALVRHIKDIDYIVTDTEVEALILECNLIKKHRPKYNVFLKDDKTYPYIKITLDEAYPRIVTTRRVKKDGAKYYGPYTSAGSLHETIRLLRRLFPIRTCKSFEKQQRACLNYHIKRCLAPCAGNVSAADYKDMINEIMNFLEGKQERLIKNLQEKMLKAAENLQYEKAGELRDQIKAVEKVLEKQKIVNAAEEDQDVIAFARGSNEVCVQVFFIRNGKVVGREHFFLDGTDSLSRSEVMTIFVKQYYSRVADIPRKILLQEPIEDKDVIEQWLKEKASIRVVVQVPQMGEKLKLLEMVGRNALLLLEEAQLSRQKKKLADGEAILQLKEYLKLTTLPIRIECYDISNIQGTSTVGSMVVFEKGKPLTDEYRRFKINTVEGANDYASLQEMLYRRFKRGAGAAALPDLVLIDGGKGQLSAARDVMKLLGFASIPAFGIAKKEELLFTENEQEPIRLPENSEALYLLQRIRDEAHRFAITYHRQLRSKDSFRSLLDEIPGIGPKRKKALLNRFGSLENIRMASLQELEQVEGMNKKSAMQVYDYLCR